MDNPNILLPHHQFTDMEFPHLLDQLLFILIIKTTMVLHAQYVVQKLTTFLENQLAVLL
jgi:hypothetical protein